MPAPKQPDDILPPDGKRFTPGRDSQAASEASRIIAKWMDEIIRIPGTNFRIGLDPIIGLFPAVGDLLTGSVGLVLVLEGVKHRLPFSVLTRMGFNVLINNAIGSIPVVGDAFSIWFKSNVRNLRLLNRWKSGDKSVKRSSRLFLGVFIFLWAAIFIGWLVIWLSLIRLVLGGF